MLAKGLLQTGLQHSRSTLAPQTRLRSRRVETDARERPERTRPKLKENKEDRWRCPRPCRIMRQLCRAFGIVLLPLDRARRFRGDVVHYAVDAFYFIDNTIGNRL
jgi:hypothetical protein